MEERYYASLIGPLMGLYFQLPLGLTEAQCRMALNSSKLARLWCSIYKESEIDEQIAKRGGYKVNNAQLLEYDYVTAGNLF